MDHHDDGDVSAKNVRLFVVVSVLGVRYYLLLQEGRKKGPTWGYGCQRLA